MKKIEKITKENIFHCPYCDFPYVKVVYSFDKVNNEENKVKKVYIERMYPATSETSKVKPIKCVAKKIYACAICGEFFKTLNKADVNCVVLSNEDKKRVKRALKKKEQWLRLKNAENENQDENQVEIQK